MTQHLLKKGDVLAVARIAGIQAVKSTATLIPLAHSGVPVEGIKISVQPAAPYLEQAAVEDENGGIGAGVSHASSAFENDRRHPGADVHDITAEAQSKEEQVMQLHRPIGLHGGVRIAVRVETTAKTGVEMEALAGVMGASLSVVDMVKSVDRQVCIEGVTVVGKKGGKSGGLGVFAGET